MNANNAKPMQPKVVIAGSSDMQNGLLSSFLQTNLGINVSICMPQNLEMLCSNQAEDSALLIFDIQDEGIDAIADFLSRSRQLAIGYNLDPEADMDAKVMDMPLYAIHLMNEPLDIIKCKIESIADGSGGTTPKPLQEHISYAITPAKLKGEISTELTGREMEVLIRIHAGMTNNEIAEEMNISFHTVKCHVYSIFKKLNVSNRFQAALWAANNLPNCRRQESVLNLP